VRVVLVSPGPVWPVNGADKLRTSQLAAELRALSVDVTVVALTWQATNEPVDGCVLVPAGAASVPGRALRCAGLVARQRVDPYADYRLPGTRGRVADAIRSARPDVVDFQHTFMWQPLALPDVLTVHNVESDRLGRFSDLPGRALRTVTDMERRAVTGAAATVVFSAEDADRVAAIGRPDVTVVPIGVDPHGRLAEPRDTLSVASYVGTFSYPPNAEAAQLLLAEWPRIKAVSGLRRLVFIGRNAAAHVTAADDVEVRSDVPDVPAALADSDVLVVPLVAGGGVRVKIIEAFALGLPVVSTALGIEGLGAVDGVHAVIVDRPDQLPEALAGCASRRSAATSRPRPPALGGAVQPAADGRADARGLPVRRAVALSRLG
jgi:glycosyltransferase involved in cell wall biosynthesis